MNNTEYKEERIAATDFIRKYNTLFSEKAKENYLMTVIKKNVVTSYAVKIVTIDNILQNSHFDKNGQVKFNSPKEYMLYTLGVIMFYSYLDINENAMDVFDSINKNEIVNVLMNKIKEFNEKDFEEFNVVFKMRKEDFVKNYNSITAIDIEKAVEAGMLKGFESILSGIQSIFENEEFLKLIQKNIDSE